VVAVTPCLVDQPILQGNAAQSPRSRSAAASAACELGLTLPWDEQSGDDVEHDECACLLIQLCEMFGELSAAERSDLFPISSSV